MAAVKFVGVSVVLAVTFAINPVLGFIACVVYGFTL